MHLRSSVGRAHHVAARHIHCTPQILQLKCAPGRKAWAANDAGAQTGSVASSVLRELPLFPVQPIGVFLPGMTKTLHLYEAHFVALMEEALKGDKLMATAVLEPFTGKEEQSAGLGSYIGGHNFALSCGCLVKILDAKPYAAAGGYLVRIRGEARIGMRALLQVEPYLRVLAYDLPDPGPPNDELPQLIDRVAALDDVMRSVQLLASKFRCDETAAIQQAFRYVNEKPMVQAVMDPPTSSSSTGAQESLETSWSSRDTSPGAVTISEGSSMSPAAVHALHGSQSGMTHETQMQAGTSDSCADHEQEMFDIQRAARLSYASLQWLPESSNEEKLAVLRGRLLAMEARSLAERVEITLATMDQARAQLAAKCALISM